MNEQVRKYLFDILDSVNALKDYFKDVKEFSKFNNNRLLKKAVEREFEVIGEAMNRILKFDNSISISNSKKIVSVRNYIAHGYDSVDYEILWSIIIKHLPLLEKEISDLMDNN